MARLLRRGTLAGIATATQFAGSAGATETRIATLPQGCESQSSIVTDGATCVANEFGTSLGFRASQITPVGTFESYATVSGQSSNAFTPERLIASAPDLTYASLHELRAALASLTPA